MSTILLALILPLIIIYISIIIIIILILDELIDNLIREKPPLFFKLLVKICKKIYKNKIKITFLIFVFLLIIAPLLDFFLVENTLNDHLKDTNNQGITRTIIEAQDPIRLRYGYPEIDFWDYHHNPKGSFCILKPYSEVTISKSIKISNGEVWHKIKGLKEVGYNHQHNNRPVFDESEYCTTREEINKTKETEATNEKNKIEKTNETKETNKTQGKNKTQGENEICLPNNSCEKTTDKDLWFIGKYRYERKSINQDYNTLDFSTGIYKFISVRTFYFIYIGFHFFMGIILALFFYQRFMEERFLNLKRMVALVLIGISLMIIASQYSATTSFMTYIKDNQENKDLIGGFIQSVKLFIFDNSSVYRNVSASFLCSMLLLQLFPSPFPVKPNKINLKLVDKN